MHNKFTYYKKLISNFLNLVLGDAFFAILGVVFSIILANHLKEEGLGIFSLAFTIATLIRVFSEAGYELSILRDTSKSDISTHADLISRTQVFKNFVLFFTLPFALIYGVFLFKDLSFIFLLIWNFPLLLNVTFRSYLKGTDKIKKLTQIEIFYSLILYSTLFINLLIFNSLSLIFLNYIFIELAKSIYLFRFISGLLPNKLPSLLYLLTPNLKNVNDTFVFCKKEFSERSQMSLMNILFSFQFRSSLVLSGIFLNHNDLGLYSTGTRFLTFLRIIPGAILNLLIPEFSQQTTNKAKNLFSKILISFFIGIIISSILYFGADEIISLTFKFKQSVLVLQLICWAFTFIMIHITIEAYLISIHKEFYINLSLSISIFTIIILSIILSFYYNLVGIIIAYLIGEIILAILYLIFAIKFIKE